MLINPKYAIEQGWISFPSWMSDEQKQKCIQPNAIDFTLDTMALVDGSPAVITEDYRKFCSITEHDVDTDGNWLMPSNLLFDCTSHFYVNLPENVACELIIRSSFSRVGVQLDCGLYDSGFKGNIGFTLYGKLGLVTTRPGTRVGQIKFISSDSEGVYAGGFNTENGEHWTEGSANVQ